MSSGRPALGSRLSTSRTTRDGPRVRRRALAKPDARAVNEPQVLAARIHQGDRLALHDVDCDGVSGKRRSTRASAIHGSAASLASIVVSGSRRSVASFGRCAARFSTCSTVESARARRPSRSSTGEDRGAPQRNETPDAASAATTSRRPRRGRRPAPRRHAAGAPARRASHSPAACPGAPCRLRGRAVPRTRSTAALRLDLGPILRVADPTVSSAPMTTRLRPVERAEEPDLPA